MADEHYTQEEWRVVYDSPSYLISNFGRIIRAKGARPKALGKLVKTWLGKDGYVMVSLIEEGASHPKGFLLNRLVCKAFHGPPPTPDHQAAHNNGNKGDNREGNLRWATSQENNADRELHGTLLRGEQKPSSKLNATVVLEIRRFKKAYGVATMLARRYGVSEQTISSILAGRIWRHVPWEPGTAPQPRVARRSA